MKGPISHWMSFAKCAKEKLPASLTQPICFFFPFMVLVEEVNMTFVRLEKQLSVVSLSPTSYSERKTQAEEKKGGHG